MQSAVTTCEPITCNGVQCQFGETCFNWNTAEFDTSVDCTRIPYAQDSHGNYIQDTCLPMPAQSNEGRIIDYGICYQTGSAAAGTACDPAAERIGENYLDAICGVGLFCQTADPEEGYISGIRGFCTPLCNAGVVPEPLKDCAGEGKYCYDLSLLGWYGFPNTTSPEARLGICMDGCDIFDPQCPEDFLGNPQGCTYDYMLKEDGFCKALVPEPTGYDQLCNYFDSEIMTQCDDGLLCIPIDETGNGFCWPFCDTSVCKSSTKCAMCSPNKCVACERNCTGKSCGADDGCGGTCGTAECSGVEPICDLRVGMCFHPACTTCGGPDGCGNICLDFDSCNAAPNSFCYNGECCTPNCAGRVCGDDGCGGTCAPNSCASGTVCAPKGTCCKPNCSGKECGDDGCGGICAPGCLGGEVCQQYRADTALGCSSIGGAPAGSVVGVCAPR
jgi:hypothetical protein